MKIITKKKADEILKRLTANEIIAIECIKDVDAHTQFVENNADIAYEVGYESGGSLSNLFIKKVGCSPREYRRTNGIF